MGMLLLHRAALPWLRGRQPWVQYLQVLQGLHQHWVVRHQGRPGPHLATPKLQLRLTPQPRQ